MEVIRGNKTLSGTWGELWINGEKIFEFSKIEMKVTAIAEGNGANRCRAPETQK